MSSGPLDPVRRRTSRRVRRWSARSIKRKEDPRLLAGKGKYVDDHNSAGMLHVAFRRSDHSHALIRSIDCARRAPRRASSPSLRGKTSPAWPRYFATSRMKNYHATAITALARGKVRYVGEPVVAVVAQSRYLAEDAVELIEIDFEPLPVVIDPEEAVKADAPLLHEDAGTNILWSGSSSGATSTRPLTRRH